MLGDAREIEVNLHVQVSWVDRKGRLLRDDQSIPLPAEIAEVSATADIVPEVGQSTAGHPARGDLPPGRADCRADGEAVVESRGDSG